MNTTNKFKYRVYGWRTGLHSKPMAFVENVQQAAHAAIKMQAELMAFDKHMTDLGPCEIRVEPIESGQPESDKADAALLAHAQDEAQWNADILASRIAMHRDAALDNHPSCPKPFEHGQLSEGQA